jgi:membrane-associated phospholipid phosphatase
MLSNIRELIVRWDHIVWYYINVQWHTPVLDFIMPFLRNPWFWAPLYLFLAVFIPSRFGRNGFVWCAGFIIAFALSDQAAASLLKPFFHRLRPCFNPYLSDIVNLLVPCGGEYGFPSVHATNHFSIGLFSAVTLGRRARWVWYIAIFWAALVSLAQVYVGVHFPLDVAFGGLVGSLIGICVGLLFNRFFALNGKHQPALVQQKNSHDF